MIKNYAGIIHTNMQTLSKTYTQIMSNKYAEHMQKLCNTYAEIMQHICNIYAKHMQELCKHYATHIQKLCQTKYATNIKNKIQTNMQK